jgi:hypothetical protein
VIVHVASAPVEEMIELRPKGTNNEGRSKKANKNDDKTQDRDT